MEIDIFKMPVLETLERCFPMMSEGQLAELTASVAKHGLLEPLVVAEVKGQTVLVDGRCRRVACQAAGVVPGVRKLDAEDDPVNFCFSANFFRQNLSQSQRAMFRAMLYPEPEEGEVIADERSVSQARTLLRDGYRGLADSVMSGAVGLKAACQEAQDQKQAAADARALHASLERQHPDLAGSIAEGEHTLASALAEAKKRDALERERAKLERQRCKLVARLKALDALA